jgi:alpha-glucosidase
MAYSFNLLTPQFSAAHIRRQVEELETHINPVSGWGCWSLSNHDVVRVMTRWGKDGADPQLAKTLLAMLGSLRGSICIYQGEELGLAEAEVPFEQLKDPYGINFWPEFKGRDGCRTPLPWASDKPHGGFSESTPWLPMPAEHLACAMDVQQDDPKSVLNFYRHFIAWRRAHPELMLGDIQFQDVLEPVLMLTRSQDSSCVLAVFNLGNKPVTIDLPAQVTPLEGHGLAGNKLDGRTLQLAQYGGFFGQVQR